MVYAQPRICPGEWDIQTSKGFWHANGSPNLDQMIKSYNNQQKKENLQNCELCCPSWSQSKIDRNLKKVKYVDLPEELEKLWIMKVTFIPIVIGALGTVTKGLV